MKLQLIYTNTPQILLSIHMYIHTYTYIFTCICRYFLWHNKLYRRHSIDHVKCFAYACMHVFAHSCKTLHLSFFALLCLCVCTLFPSFRAWEYNWNCCINNKRKYHEKKINFILIIMQTSLQRIEMRGRATKEKTEKREREV